MGTIVNTLKRIVVGGNGRRRTHLFLTGGVRRGKLAIGARAGANISNCSYPRGVRVNHDHHQLSGCCSNYSTVSGILQYQQKAATEAITRNEEGSKKVETEGTAAGEGDGGQEEEEYDDINYFKGLSKSVNPYWEKNAEEVFQRLDWGRLVDPGRGREELEKAFHRRYVDVELDKILELWGEREVACKEGDEERRLELTRKLVGLALWIPNRTHEEAAAIGDEIPKEVGRWGEARSGEGVEEFSKFCYKHGLLRDDQLGNLAYHRSYYLKGPLAELEEGLVRYSLNTLAIKDFQLLSVPDIVHPHIIESCGMRTRNERDQVFWLQSPSSSEDACLSGTAEMSIGGSLQNKIFNEEDLPLKFTSVSRCYRAEASSLEEERGLFRVHEFSKVEMFGVTANETGEESNALHQEIREIEEGLFADLNLHFKTLEMPPSELGTSAYRKFDIEAWMPGRQIYGEISSCSNCTDFQSRRFNIRYKPKNNRNDLKYVHTVNGTACAIPRMLITLVETFQTPDGSLELPPALRSFMPRDWRKSMESFQKYRIRFMRTKSQQDKYIHNKYKTFY